MTEEQLDVLANMTESQLGLIAIQDEIAKLRVDDQRNVMKMAEELHEMINKTPFFIMAFALVGARLAVEAEMEEAQTPE
jgi:hypothetical protein